MNYVKKVLKDFRMQRSKPVSTPLVTHFTNFQKLCQHSLRKKRSTSHVPYSSVVGSMMYAIVCTHSNISHAVSVVNEYMINLGKEHWQAVKWILQYLRGTTDVGLVYGKVSTNSSIVVRFVDDQCCRYVDQVDSFA